MRIIPLGGVEEIGINCTVYEYHGRIVVVDMGLGFPENNMYGIDYIVPNINYLEKNKHRIEGIVITHGHLDHIGALPYLLPKLNFPHIYGTEFTVELIRAKMKDFNLDGKVSLNVISDESVLKSGDFTLKFFRVNHSIPQCVGVVIETPDARVVQTGDFKFDNSPVNEPVADYGRIAEIGKEGVDILLSDSTNSLRKGHPISESEVAVSLAGIVERAKGRVIVSTFSGLVGRLYQLIQIAEAHNRKVAVGGYSMNQTLRIAQEIGYIKPKPEVIVPIQKVNRYSDNRIMILTTGSQGEENAALARMATGEYKTIQLKKGDTVVLSAGTIPGNNLAVQNLIDAISAKGARVHQSEDMDFFTSGHGYKEDQKIMLNLVKPKYFMPVHGYQYFLREHGRTAVQVGVPEKNVFIAKRGSIIEGNNKDGFQIVDQFKATPLLISGTGVGDIGTSVLAERENLGKYGVVVISILLEQKTKKPIQPPSIYTKGFVYVKTSGDVLDEIHSIVKQTLDKHNKNRTVIDLRQQIDQEITRYVEKETGRTPVIVVMINTINPASLLSEEKV